MSYTTQAASAPLDYGFLLLVHLICADKQIHSEEFKYLRELGIHADISQQTKDEMYKILAQEDNHLTVDDIAKQVSVDEQSEVMRQILAIAYTDGYFAPSEREIVDHLASIWNWSNKEIDRIIAEAESLGDRVSKNNNSNQTELSFAAKLFKNEQKSALSRAIIGMAAKAAPEVIGQKVERLEREILLFGSEYDEAIEQCSKIAQEDYQYAELAFKKTESTLKTLILSLGEVMLRIETKNSKATTAKEVANQLEESRKYLDAEIIKELNKVQESHQSKQRALSYFTIAFMGRTKAGKSTLHSIITQDGWESIGVGKQRTTRLNRIYEWKNIRIIDTPGIGAADAGGRNDEEIAQSIVDEADVICYVVTNDSIQETEFKFLEQLKEKAKPLIIILNLKYNLRDSRRLQHFLENPNKLFSKDGESGIGGHIDRIRRHVSKNYNNYFAIVPVMLLAAQLSSETEHQKNKNKLYKASRIQDFLDSIRESLIKHGAIRRSQTFLGSTVGSIEYPNRWIISQKQSYQQLIHTLKNKLQTTHRDIQQAKIDALESQRLQIEKIFQKAFNAIPDFAEDYWEEGDESTMNRGWKQKLNEINFEQNIKSICEEAAEQFNIKVKESLEEIGNELQLISKLNSSNFSLKSQDSFDTRKLLQIGGSVLGLVGTALLFTPLAPISLAVGIIAGVVGFIGSWFKSRDQKQREAVAKISESLESQLQKEKQTILNQTDSNFIKYCSDVSENIEQYFNELIQGLEAISSELEKVQRSFDAIVNYLNSGYAKRIIDWSMEQYETLTIETVKRTVVKVERNFGRSIDIKTKSNVEIKKSIEEMKQILQEDIVIKVINY